MLLTFLTLLAISIAAQEKTNDAINGQIRALGIDHVNVTFDQPSNSSKLMAVAENFPNREAESAGVQAINFAMGFFYSGKSLKTVPDTIHFSFWVLTKKPRFAENHKLIVDLDGRSLDLGDSRYAAKPNQNLEYLNFDIARSDLASIAAASKVTFRVGTRIFAVSSDQLKLIRAVTRIADVAVTN